MNVTISELRNRENLKFENSKALNNAESWVKYFKKNLHIGLELELEYYDDGDSVDVINVFGLRLNDYHIMQDCSTCKKGDIYNCIGKRVRIYPEDKAFLCHALNDEQNIIVNCELDGSIDGVEFLLHGGNMNTKDFMEKLPIKKWSDYFEANNNCSIHAHCIIPYNKRLIPIIIPNNLYQLFKKYYIGLVYLTGTTPKKALRINEYSEFYGFTRTFERYFSSHSRCALNFQNCRHNLSQVGELENLSHFDVEIRTYNASIDKLHIALCRFLSKALVLRAVELSQFGVLQIINNETWRKTKEIIERLNCHYEIEDEEKEFMQKTAKELYIEIEHLLTPLEKKIMDNFIKNPKWFNPHFNTTITTKEKSEFDKVLIMLVKTKSYFAKDRQNYYRKLAKVLNTTEDYVRNRLNEIGANWNKEIGTYTLNNY